jgi:tetratricopeptide (TPR) repeat protein
MNQEDNNYLGEDNISEALNRFKASLMTGSKNYFDVSEFEEIVEYFLDEGDINSSEIAARQGIQIHPGSVQLKLKYAEVLLNSGKYDSAFDYLEMAEQIESANPDIHFIKGSAWLIIGENEKAEKSFDKALEIAGTDREDILCQIGAAYIQAGENHKGIEYYEKVLKINPVNEIALYELGFISDQSGDFQKSINYYNRYLDNDPFNHYIWFNLGISYNKSENYKKAVEAYEFALALKEDFYQALFNLANSCANIGKFKRAVSKYMEYLEHDPDNDDAWCYIGECYLNLEDYNKSEYYYQKAISINQDNDVAWFGAGLIMWLEHKWQESIVFMEKALKIDDMNQEYWLALARIYNDCDLNHKAENALMRAAGLEPGNSEVWLTWVDFCAKSGEIDKAIAIMKSAMETNGDVLLKYRTVGLLLEKKKDNEACELLVSAMKQEFVQLQYLYDVYPEALKNKKINKLIDSFRGKYPL